MKNRIFIFLIRILNTFISKDHSQLKNKITANFNDHIGSEIQTNGFYESFYLKNIIPYLNKQVFYDTMLDVGANIGNHSVFFSNYFNRIYSFEPQKTTYKLLEINTERIPNIKTFNYGISSSNLKRELFINSKNRGMVSGQKIDDFYFKEEVQFKPFKIKNEEKISYIKIDVEGNEIDVLKALKAIIIKDHPIISFEFNDHHTKENIEDLLNGYGYQNFYVFNRDVLKGFLSKVNFNKLARLRKTPIDKSKNYGIVFTFSESSLYKLNGI
jgi:FkbM family methyltransferase